MPNHGAGRRRFQINVTQADIEHGLQNNSYHCAVSCAIARELPDAVFISTDIQTIRFSLAESGVRYVYLTPTQVQEYVIAFDAGDHLQPFTFNLYTPAWQSSRYIGRSVAPTKPHPDDTVALVNVGHGVVEVPQARMQPRQLRITGRRVYGLRAMRVNKQEE